MQRVTQVNIQPDSHIPIFEQIAEGVRALIASGVHKPGEALPSLRAMAKKIRVNPNTVQRAYDLLERGGYITTRRGIGVFVSDRGPTTAVASAETVFRQDVRAAIQHAMGSSLSVTRLRQIFREEMDAARVEGLQR